MLSLKKRLSSSELNFLLRKRGFGMYEGLSLFYNTLTYDINYGALARFVDRTVKKSAAWKDYARRGEKPILLDAGTGTGNFVGIMAENYDCIGLDVSEEMLDIARSNANSGNILWICQDMCRMDLFGSVTAITSLTDSVNHLLTEKRLSEFFMRAHNFLDPGGLLIFDVLTDSHFDPAGREAQFFADFDNESCFWNCVFDPKKRICTYNISCFRLIDPEKSLYERRDDVVREKIWTEDTLTGMLKEAGFVKTDVIKGGDKGAPGGRTGRDRLYFICTKGKL